MTQGRQVFPPPSHPFSSIKALRLITAAGTLSTNDHHHFQPKPLHCTTFSSISDSHGIPAAVVVQPPVHSLPQSQNTIMGSESQSILYHNQLCLVTAILDACWAHGLDISNDKTLLNVCNSVQMDGTSLLHRATHDEDIKIMLRQNTDEALTKGIFGVPTIDINNELFWGSESDTLLHIRYALEGKPLLASPTLVEHWRNIQPSAMRLKKQ